MTLVQKLEQSIAKRSAASQKAMALLKARDFDEYMKADAEHTAANAMVNDTQDQIIKIMENGGDFSNKVVGTGPSPGSRIVVRHPDNTIAVEFFA